LCGATNLLAEVNDPGDAEVHREANDSSEDAERKQQRPVVSTRSLQIWWRVGVEAVHVYPRGMLLW
jgi:hypothetical protein